MNMHNKNTHNLINFTKYRSIYTELVWQFQKAKVKDMEILY